MIPVLLSGKPLTTPKKTPVTVPTQALADAIANEAQPTPGKIPPMRGMAFAAIDVIKLDPERIIEVLMAYVDTDALCYRAENPELNKLQEELLNPIVQWLETRFDMHIETTTGLLPIEQSEEVGTRLRGYLQSLDAFHMAGVLTLTQAASSIFLAIATAENHIDVETLAHAARMEEDWQLERYGADEEALKRREQVVTEIDAASQFLALLK